jgi:hypothetical protein
MGCLHAAAEAAAAEATEAAPAAPRRVTARRRTVTSREAAMAAFAKSWRRE